MPDIFLSYSRHDLERVRPIAEALEAEGWSVFWDRRIPAGKTWRQFIGEALADSRCVMVVWTKSAIESDWVIEEADFGKKRGALIPTRLDAVDPPLGFGAIQAADLLDWKGSSESPAFRVLLGDIKALLGEPEAGVSEAAATPEESPPPERVATQEVTTPSTSAPEPQPVSEPPLAEDAAAAIQSTGSGMDTRQSGEREGPKSPAKIADLSSRKIVLWAIVGVAVFVVGAVYLSTGRPPEAGSVFRDALKSGGKGPEMVVIPAGEFRMGDIQGGGDADEQPVHKATVNSFAMGKREVTVDEFRRFVEAESYKTDAERSGDGCYVWTGTTFESRAGASWRMPGFSQSDENPVVCVSWNDTLAYARWLSEQTGKRYRLPREAEWEYAARAGSETKYWWGDDIGENRANCSGCGGQWDGKQTAPVGSFDPNAFGLYDTVGNVLEWTCSLYEDRYAGAEQKCADPGAAGRRVVRGGSWSNGPRDDRSADRGRNTADDRYDNVGFRLAQDIP
jgi:formylglycine-generating enzyme required for sulfatase activity